MTEHTNKCRRPRDDATNPDLDTFKGHGGKLIIVQGTTDMLVAPAMTTAYFNQVSARYGSQTKDFVRYYVEPGFGHGGDRVLVMNRASMSTLVETSLTTTPRRYATW